MEPTTKPTSQLPASLQAAQLQVVLPGSRASFRRRVMDAMRALVSAPGAFCFFGKEDSRAYADASRLVEGANAPMKATAGTPPRLSQAFGFEPKSLVSTLRRVYQTSELYPDAERVKLPYFRDHSVALGFTRALLLFFHEGGVLFGLAGLERREKDGEFTEENLQVIEELAPFVVAGARAQLQYEELTREAAALRALTRIHGGLYVVDRDKKRVLWAADRDNGIDWEQDVVPVEEQLVSAAEVMIASKAKGEAIPPTPPTLPQGTVMAVAKIDGDPVFANARCAVVRVEATSQQPAMEGLSRREREIARLLVAGYSGVNVAAIAGLSENTVRTYVRRLYGKLGVSNRADLVRKLVSPEPQSGVNSSSGPSSQIAPPPDSSLVSGDDTLD